MQVQEQVWRDPRELKRNPRNTRKHSREQIEAIKASIREFGFIGVLALKDDAETVGAGNGRHEAVIEMLDAGETIPRSPDGKSVATVTVCGLSDDQWDAWAIADNRLAEQSTWDYDALTAQLGSLGSLGQVAGFSLVEVGALLGGDLPPTLDQLADRFGQPAESDFWPTIKVKAPESTEKMFLRLMKAARGAGGEEHQQLLALLKAVDESKLPPAPAAKKPALAKRKAKP